MTASVGNLSLVRDLLNPVGTGCGSFVVVVGGRQSCCSVLISNETALDGFVGGL